MNKTQEKWAIFWCDLLSPVIYGEIEPENTHQFLKTLAKKPVQLPDGNVKKPSLSTLKRKLKKYNKGGFDTLARKKRNDAGKPRHVSSEVIQKAIELKKEQPLRSPQTINRFLKDIYGKIVPASTLYRHLKDANATRLKLGVIQKKVRKRWSRDHTHDLWVGDFEDGPYVAENHQVLPTYLSAFIDCHSRYAVEARYYLRENLDVLIDSFIRAMATHGAPLCIYVDNAKIYHANGLKAACHRCNIKLMHRPPGDPSPGGLIERLIRTIQDQFEAEVRAGRILTLAELNRSLSAWLAVSYHGSIHSETGETPKRRYQNGLVVIRQIDIGRALESFMTRVQRTVNKTFSDVQLNKRYYRVDPKLRGDRVEVRYDPFSMLDTVAIYSLKDQYLTTGKLHDRSRGIPTGAGQQPGGLKYNYLELLVRKHKHQLAEQTGGIDYRNVVDKRPWPFHEFAKTVADLMGRKAGLADLTTEELESLKKVFNQSLCINRKMVKLAFEKALYKSVPYIVRELQYLIKKEAI